MRSCVDGSFVREHALAFSGPVRLRSCGATTRRRFPRRNQGGRQACFVHGGDVGSRRRRPSSCEKARHHGRWREGFATIRLLRSDVRVDERRAGSVNRRRWEKVHQIVLSWHLHSGRSNERYKEGTSWFPWVFLLATSTAASCVERFVLAHLQAMDTLDAPGESLVVMVCWRLDAAPHVGIYLRRYLR